MLSKHLFFNVVFFTVSLSLFNSKDFYSVDPCESVKISVEITKSSNIFSKAEVKVTGGKAPVRYFFSDAKGDLINQNYTIASVENLKPGKYTCLVKEAGNCRKKIEFEIK